MIGGALFFVLGLIVGSFLNVCIYRLPRRESIAWPASHCTSCDRALSWYENVPVVSWIVLRARCRTCKARIAWTYPVVELAAALLFFAGYEVFGPTPLLAVRVLFGCALIVLFVIDLEHKILPNAITLPGIVLGFLASFALPPGWLASMLGIIFGGAIPFAIAEAYARLRGHEGLGMGDVKMLAMIGAFLGWQLMLVTLVFASFAGSIVGLGFIAAGRGLKYALPFGTFLAAGAFIATFFGEPLLHWYLSFY